MSNKTSDEGDSSVDPVEQQLYLVFVANSERMRVADTAAILNVDAHELQVRRRAGGAGGWLVAGWWLAGGWLVAGWWRAGWWRWA